MEDWFWFDMHWFDMHWFDMHWLDVHWFNNRFRLERCGNRRCFIIERIQIQIKNRIVELIVGGHGSASRKRFSLK